MKTLNKRDWIIITFIFVFLVAIISLFAYYNFFVGPSIINVQKTDSVRFANKKIFNIEVSNSPLKLDKSTWCLLVEKLWLFLYICVGAATFCIWENKKKQPKQRRLLPAAMAVRYGC